jgi:hypothetical protein
MGAEVSIAGGLSSTTVEQLLSVIERLLTCTGMLTDASAITMAEALVAMAGAFTASQSVRAMRVAEALVNSTGGISLELGSAALSTATFITGESATSVKISLEEA